ncbi:PAS domain-containing sensor histidine kinase [Sphingomonas radiodurans]|uniref:PAS domain-containing sensor histidine kinase n=1 Tax=Sphingomonas radiodurans TaxID=2890321 RepID=UPI001E64D69C|nr:PAS domain-containing sensor histidine kinase [Sphingomonas radiodurans]WBH16231.1 PAS domain-containing protein [Sphingomonas radiodurans]
MLNMEDLYRLLRTGHVQAQGIVDTVSDPLLVLDSSLCVQSASRSFFETFHVDRYETIGKPLYELGDGQWDIPTLRSLLTEVIPRATAILDYQVEHDFPHLGRRTMLLTARTLHHPDISSHTMLLSIVDVTERKRKDTARDLLFGELRHRMKNLLGLAQSMARQMPAEGCTAAQYRDDFLGRFSALMDAEDVAFSEHDQGDLTDLLERVFAPYLADSAAALITPSEAVDLSPRMLTSLGLAFHELATNAAKYGALSVPGGKVRVGWTVEKGSNALRITWSESNGPPVTPPTTTGYGTQLIESTITYSLFGTIKTDYAKSGVQVDIVIPLDEGSPKR